MQSFRITGLFSGQYNNGVYGTFTGVILIWRINNLYTGANHIPLFYCSCWHPFYCDQTNTLFQASNNAAPKFNISTKLQVTTSHIIFILAPTISIFLLFMLAPFLFWSDKHNTSIAGELKVEADTHWTGHGTKPMELQGKGGARKKKKKKTSTVFYVTVSKYSHFLALKCFWMFWSFFNMCLSALAFCCF